MQLKDLFLTRDVTALLEELTEASRILPEGLTPSTRLLGGPVVDALADLRPEDADVLVCGSRVTVRRVGCSSAASPHGSSGMRDCR